MSGLGKFSLLALWCAALLLVGEVGFRAFLSLTQKPLITLLPVRQVLNQAWFKPHPHLIYVFKPSSSFTMQAFDHPLITVNQFGFRSTREFDVQGVDTLPNTIRLATLGGSTAMGVNDDREIWPYLLGSRVAEAFPGRRTEVLNEGLMGYNSLDNLLDLSMRVIDFHPQVYILYLGINDFLTKAPQDVYRSDNSHFRKTLHESLNLSAVDLLPDFFLRSYLVRAILQVIGVPDRRDLLANTGTGQFRGDFALEEAACLKANQTIRQTVQRNVRSMVGVIRSHDPNALVFVSSFFLAGTPPRCTQDYVEGLNRDLKDLAQDMKVDFLDPAGRLPHTQEMVYDQVHFTRDGDRQMADLFAAAVISKLRE